MRLTRRNALIGMGTVAAGAGVIGGTGAFTSVSAERTVSVQTTGDDDAALQLIPAGSNDSGGATANAGDYVDDSGDTIQIDLTSTGNGATGLNQNAKTVLENLVSVLNNGTQSVTGLTLTMSTTVSNVTADDTFKFTASEKVEDGSDLTDIPNGKDILSSQQLNTTIGAGSDSVDFGLIVDLINGGNNSNALPSSSSDSYTLTISATTQ